MKKDAVTFNRKISCFLRMAAVVFTGLLLMGAEGTGCLFLDDPEAFLDGESSKEAKYVISIHEVVKYRRGSEFEQEVDSFFGKNICVNRNYFLHSKDVMEVEAVRRVDNPDFYDLRLTLSSRGVKLWSAFSVTTRVDRKEMAFLVDGMYYRSFQPPILLDSDTTVVTVEGPFDPATVSGIVKYARINYRKWNDR